MAASLVVTCLLAAASAAGSLENLESPDPSTRIAAVRALRETPGEEVSEALARLLRDPDPAVREAAVRALGPRADGPSVQALRRALRRFAKDEALLPVVVAAIGEARDAGSAGEIVKLARKALGRDPALADAAILALGSLRSADAVEGLIELLGTAEPVRGGAGTRAGHARYVAGIRRSLFAVTGLPFRAGETWGAWWRHARRNWRPTPLDPAEVEGLERRDDGWRFSISRPDAERWAFEGVRGAALRIRFTGPEDEAGTTWIDVMVHAAAEWPPRSLEEAARERAEKLRAELARDVKSIELGRPGRLGSEPAVLHEALGMLSSGRVMRRRIYMLARNGLLYAISVHVASGASERAEGEVEAILASFRLLDR